MSYWVSLKFELLYQFALDWHFTEEAYLLTYYWIMCFQDIQIFLVMQWLLWVLVKLTTCFILDVQWAAPNDIEQSVYRYVIMTFKHSCEHFHKVGMKKIINIVLFSKVKKKKIIFFFRRVGLCDRLFVQYYICCI